jgi:hypothetical protein
VVLVPVSWYISYQEVFYLLIPGYCGTCLLEVALPLHTPPEEMKQVTDSFQKELQMKGISTTKAIK